MRTIATLLFLLLAVPAASQTDEAVEEYAAQAFDRYTTSDWTKTDTAVISFVAAAVVAATAFDYSSCGSGFKAKDHPVYGTHCMRSVQTPDGERTLTYNTKPALRGGCTMTEDGEKCGEIGKRMLGASLGLALLGAWLIASDDDPVTRDLEISAGPGGAVATKSFGW